MRTSSTTKGSLTWSLWTASPNAESKMGDVGRYELVISKEVSWEEVVEVMKCLKRGEQQVLMEL